MPGRQPGEEVTAMQTERRDAELQRKFHRAMYTVYERAIRECNYTATYFLRMLQDHGGLGTAQGLLHTDKPSDGFNTLLMHRRLDISMEALIAEDPTWWPLFAPEELATARRRLVEVGYTPNVRSRSPAARDTNIR
jgi:hypothetical protein